MGVGASILILSGIVGAAFGGRLFLCMAIEDELVDIGERGKLRLQCGVVALRVRNASATHRDLVRQLGL